MNTQEDTIAAVATPLGPGGIGIVKLSGPGSLDAARRLFRPSSKRHAYVSHRLSHGFIKDPETGRILDEVLLSYMAAPKSYTGEDVVEINCHSGTAVLAEILELVLKEGVRPAQPGEFTRRAFLNGRIDLVRAEAVADLITARSKRALTLAAAQLEGGLSGRLEHILARVMELSAEIEAQIDFSDDDVETAGSGELLAAVETVFKDVEELIATFEQGRLFREGFAVVLAGRPNVGKSSLLNALLGRDRAIVTEEPGTTRDVIEEMVELGSLPVRLVDTAGLREPAGPVDREGIRRALAAAGSADLVLWVIDGHEGLSPHDLAAKEEIRGYPRLALINKVDLSQAIEPGDARELLGEDEVLFVSAMEGTGLRGLKEAITRRAFGRGSEPEPEDCAVNLRHREELALARDALGRAARGLKEGLGPELVAVEVRDAAYALERILGLAVSGDVLDMIFSRFCVGK